MFNQTQNKAGEKQSGAGGPEEDEVLQESEGRRACTIGLFRESNIAWCVAARACVRAER